MIDLHLNFETSPATNDDCKPENDAIKLNYASADCDYDNLNLKFKRVFDGIRIWSSEDESKSITCSRENLSENVSLSFDDNFTQCIGLDRDERTVLIRFPITGIEPGEATHNELMFYRVKLSIEYKIIGKKLKIYITLMKKTQIMHISFRSMRC